MAKRKYFHIEMKNQGSDERLPWFRPPECSYVSKEYAKGYISCIKSYYPCPNIRLIDAETGEIVEEISGNGEVHLNTN